MKEAGELAILHINNFNVIEVKVEDLGCFADKGTGAGHQGEGDQQRNEAGCQVDAPDYEGAGPDGGAGAAAWQPGQGHHHPLEY